MTPEEEDQARWEDNGGPVCDEDEVCETCEECGWCTTCGECICEEESP